MRTQIKNTLIRLIEGDITALDVDAVVNAANAGLQMGGGVAGAIRRAGGPAIQEECDRIGGTYVGGAVITTGGRLKARHVIHAVGPRMGEGDEDEKLRKATLNSLRRADENQIKSIAFPAISTGIFGFPRKRCADIMLKAVKSYLQENESGIEEVIFCLYGTDALRDFEEAMSGIY